MRPIDADELIEAIENFMAAYPNDVVGATYARAFKTLLQTAPTIVVQEEEEA